MPFFVCTRRAKVRTKVNLEAAAEESSDGCDNDAEAECGGGGFRSAGRSLTTRETASSEATANADDPQSASCKFANTRKRTRMCLRCGINQSIDFFETVFASFLGLDLLDLSMNLSV